MREKNGARDVSVFLALIQYLEVEEKERLRRGRSSSPWNFLKIRNQIVDVQSILVVRDFLLELKNYSKKIGFG